MGHGGGGHEIVGHKLAYLFGYSFNIDTLYMTWISMAVVIVLSYVATRRMALVPTGLQNVYELIATAWLNQMNDMLGPKSKKLAPIILTLFFFILVANLLGLIPGFTSPTNDLNTTLGLAILVILLVHACTIANKGLKAYILHYFKPYIPFVVINLIEEVAKPVTLACRLFGNIMGGEIMIAVLAFLVPMWIPIPNIGWLGFSVFVGCIQAFVFTMLSIAYLTGAFNPEEH